MYTYVMETPVGKITLKENNGSLTGLYFGDSRAGGLENDETALLRETRRQLEMYFSGALKSFDLPLEPEGTEFRKKVWNALLEIPYGETESYAGIAAKIGNPKAVRAVGGANHNNPISIIIPCHRVIGADGSLTGYGGGLEAKRFLLKLESANK